MSENHSELVRLNFEQKAADYDEFMLKCVPHYTEMIETLVDAIPFKSDEELSICDLGSGTGNTTQLLRDAYPKAKITCVDVSSMMSDMAKSKLKNEDINFVLGDFNCFEFTQQYDIIVSTLALHHIVTDEQKKSFYQQIYNALKPDGLFFNGDIIISNAKSLEMHQMILWKEWLHQFHTEDELMETVIDRYYEEDKPTTLVNHLNWLEEIGFKDVDVVWKKLKIAVFGGFK